MVSVPINKIWNTYEHIKFVSHAHRNLQLTNVEASIDPYQVYWVPTVQIKKMSCSSFDFIKDTGRVIDGAWDKNFKKIHEGRYYKRFEQVFCYGNSWKQTDYYDRKINQIKESKSNRFSTVGEFERKLNLYECLYDSFKMEQQYKLQSELVVDNDMSSPGDGGRALFPSLTDHTLMRHEIAVNIGRDGTLLRNDGRHRLALALLAGLDEVPVRIVVRHTEWQDLRDKVAQTIDEGLDNGMPAEEIQDYVEQTLADELETVSMGLDHPDLAIIFERRLSDPDPK